MGDHGEETMGRRPWGREETMGSDPVFGFRKEFLKILNLIGDHFIRWIDRKPLIHPEPWRTSSVRLGPCKLLQ